MMLTARLQHLQGGTTFPAASLPSNEQASSIAGKVERLHNRAGFIPWYHLPVDGCFTKESQLALLSFLNRNQHMRIIVPVSAVIAIFLLIPPDVMHSDHLMHLGQGKISKRTKDR
jgi:hypothetical protein